MTKSNVIGLAGILLLFIAGVLSMSVQFLSPNMALFLLMAALVATVLGSRGGNSGQQMVVCRDSRGTVDVRACIIWTGRPVANHVVNTLRRVLTMTKTVISTCDT
jgi:hypothetical protein